MGERERGRPPFVRCLLHFQLSPFQADKLLFETLKYSGVCESACSEEVPVVQEMGGKARRTRTELSLASPRLSRL